MLPDAEVVYRKGCDIIDPHFPESEILDFPKTEEESRLMDEAVAAAQNAEVVIMVLGGNELTVREDRSRTSLELPGRQEELLKAVMGTGTPVVLVLLDGRAATIMQRLMFRRYYMPGFPVSFAGRQWLRLCLEITIRVEDWL